MIIDNFLAEDTYKALKQFSLECEFEDLENEVDGVVYPYICAKIPSNIKEEVFDKLSELKGSPISNNVMFLRMTKLGTPCPHVAHTDAVMGKNSFMLYLHDHPFSGTTFLRHAEAGITYHPEHEIFQQVVQRDGNDLSKWVRTGSIQAAENRAAVFDSHLIHCAEPVGGFGETQRTARIVLTCFYD